MVYTPEEITDNCPIFPMTQTTVKKPSARKSLRLFTNIFDVKKITAIGCVEPEKSKPGAITVGNSLSNNKKRKGN